MCNELLLEGMLRRRYLHLPSTGGTRREYGPILYAQRDIGLLDMLCKLYLFGKDQLPALVVDMLEEAIFRSL